MAASLQLEQLPSLSCSSQTSRSADLQSAQCALSCHTHILVAFHHVPQGKAVQELLPARG